VQKPAIKTSLQNTLREKEEILEMLGEIRETVSTITAIQVATLPDELFEVPEGWRVEAETVVAAPGNGDPE